MASVHRDPRRRSPYWYAAFTLPNGKRAFRSTKQTDRKKAWDVARALEKAGERVRAGTLSQAVVRKLFNDLLESIGENPLATETPKSFFTAWLSGKEFSTKPGSYQIYKKVVTKFLTHLGPKALGALSDVSVGDIASYRDLRLKNEGVSVGTLTLDLKALRGMFEAARRQGYLEHNPAQAVELPAAAPIEREVFSHQEISALLTSSPSVEWRTVILLGFLAGLRLADAACLCWDSIDLERGILDYQQGKTGRRVTVPIHSDLEQQLLSVASSDSPGGFVSPILAKTPVAGRAGLSCQFTRIMQAAGVDRRQVQSAKRQFSKRSFHALRHSFASALANRGVSAELRMRLTGHKSLDVHQTYSHVEVATLKDAIAALPRLEQSKD